MTDTLTCTRLIPCLDLANGRVVKGTNFVDLKDVGDPVELACRYQEEGADELILLDISATQEERNNFFHVMQEISDNVSIPVGIGGGIRTVEDATRALLAGAEKVGVNSAAVARAELITELAERFGSQCVMISIDARKVNDHYEVVVRSGTQVTELDAVSWAKEAVRLGAGEVLLTSIDRDGTRIGYDIEMLRAVKDAVNVPVIASGGAGKISDVVQVYETGVADAALLAGILHDGTTSIADIKAGLKDSGFVVRDRGKLM